MASFTAEIQRGAFKNSHSAASAFDIVGII